MELEIDQIYCIDALELLRQLPSHSVDMLLTDPPYGISYKNHFTTRPHPKIIGDDGLDFETLANQCYRVLKSDTHAYFFTRFDRYPRHFQALEQAGFRVKNCLVIEKRTVGGIGDLYGNFSNNAEWVIFCQKGRRLFSQTQLLKNKKAGIFLGRNRPKVAEYKTRFPACWFGPEYPKATYNSTWQKAHGIYHPTIKDQECLEWLIQISTAPGELIVDPFMGSGSTALAAQHTGRHFIGSEIDRQYYELSIRRLQNTE